MTTAALQERIARIALNDGLLKKPATHLKPKKPFKNIGKSRKKPKAIRRCVARKRSRNGSVGG